MTNPTTPFSWQMPTASDLVTDLPADFETFGQAVATSMADLLGGTTGQILSKASNTDMDFTWVTNDVGDITAVTASAPLTGGGTSGAITVGIQDGTTTQKGAVQLENSTSSTSTTTAAVPASVKSAYDLADGAIAKSTLTTAGDIIFRNATVPTRLGIGTANQVLRVNSGATAPEWATVSSGALTLISTTTFSAVSTQTFNSVFSSTYRNYKIIMSVRGTSDPYQLRFYYRASGTNNTSANYNWGQYNAVRDGTLQIGSSGSDVANMPLGPSSAPTGSTVAFNVDATVFQPFGLGQRQTMHLSYTNSTNGGHGWSALQGYENTAYDGFAITPSAGTISGTVSVYGIGN